MAIKIQDVIVIDNSRNILNAIDGNFSGTITANQITGTLNGNATTATALQTTRTIWGQNFNGSGNVTGNLTSVGNITGNGAITITAGGTNQNIILTPTGTGTVNAPTFNATSATNGGFQGISADSATTPSFTWSGDLTTGIWRPNTNQVGITTNGVNRLTISNTNINSSLPVTIQGNLILGTQANRATITYPTNAARTYTIPDVGLNTSFLMTDGTQTIGGFKTFSVPIRSSFSHELSLANDYIGHGDGFSFSAPSFPIATSLLVTFFHNVNRGLQLTTPSHTLAPLQFRKAHSAFPGGGLSSWIEIIDNTNNQTIGGTKTFTNSITTQGNLILGTQANRATITYPTNAARTYTIPDVGGNAQFAMSTNNVHPDDNMIINGAMQHWQRNTVSTAFGYVAADRWVHNFQGGSSTMQRLGFVLGDTLGGNQGHFFLRQSVSGQSSASDYCKLQQRIENVRSYAGQNITVLFWARRVSGAGNIVVEGGQFFGNGGGASAPVTGINPTTITLGPGWQQYAVIMNVPSIASKVIGTDGLDSFELTFWLSGGSNWNSRSNSLGIQTIGVDIWGVHIRRGSHPASAMNSYRIPFIGTELIKCQRYYCTTIANARFFASGANQIVDTSVFWPVTMRIPPFVFRTGPSSNVAEILLTSISTLGLRFSIRSGGVGDTWAIDNTIAADAEV